MKSLWGPFGVFLFSFSFYRKNEHGWGSDMTFTNQRILPAARKVKDLEKLMKLSYEHIVILDTHISQISSIVQLAKSHGKKPLLHADLIEGLKNDEYAAEYLCQVVKPAGIVSTGPGSSRKRSKTGCLRFSAYSCWIRTHWRKATRCSNGRSPITSKCFPVSSRI
ncbi:Glycerol-3-phosphate responsive antiterminator [Paenibacillus sp. P1XP2]|nr:Glycerol-3-phosphate responsive antiterminator [Paenibacillus sp. P1XP2]